MELSKAEHRYQATPASDHFNEVAWQLSNVEHLQRERPGAGRR